MHAADVITLLAAILAILTSLMLRFIILLCAICRHFFFAAFIDDAMPLSLLRRYADGVAALRAACHDVISPRYSRCQ